MGCVCVRGGGGCSSLCLCTRLSNGRHLCEATETRARMRRKTEAQDTEKRRKHLTLIGSLAAQVERLRCVHLGMNIMAPLPSV